MTEEQAIDEQRAGVEPRAMMDRAIEFLFGPAPPDALPERVQSVITENQRSSEILVCLAQFGAIIFFGAFYLLTPKGFSEMVPFEPVPIALTVYTFFTAFRLWLTMTDRLTPAFIGLSVVVDIAVLMVTIWSFHLQYQQPATIYLKAPTLLYVFILIALRTLRFEAVYVVLAGAAAVVGWLTLVAYAVFSGGEMAITRDFTEYMTSQAILIGAEIDKLIAIASVSGVLAVAVVRARRLLIRAALDSHAASELSRFFAPEVASEIRAVDTGFRPGDAVRREAAVMVLDLRGFTRFAAHAAPEETMALLSEYHRRIVPVIQNHEGSIDKYLGDGVICTFGAARTSEHYAADAVRALEAVMDEMQAWNIARREAGESIARIGGSVAVGPVLFGVTGAQSRLEFTVIGDAVNLAAKLEKHCKVVDRPALVTRLALDLAIEQGLERDDPVEDLPDQMIEGIEEPIDIVSLPRSDFG